MTQGPGETGTSVDELAPLLGRTARLLAEGGARTEALAELVEGRRFLGLGGSPRFMPRGRVWRLGVLLLDAGARPYAVGGTTRALEPRQHGYTATSAHERAELRALAVQSYPVGETVNFDAVPLALDEASLEIGQGPLRLSGGEVLIQWAPGGRAVPIAAYLGERVELLLSGSR